MQSDISRRVFCRRIARFTTGLAFLPLTEVLVSCDSEKKRVLHPTVQVNGTDVITNTRYIGDVFAFPEHMVVASLMPKFAKVPLELQDVSFVGVIAQNTSTAGSSKLHPSDVALVGLFRDKNGVFRYGYEINGVRSYVEGKIPRSDYQYCMDFSLNMAGLVVDPDYPNEKRYGYELQVSSGPDESIRFRALKSASHYANQLFIGVMDERNNVSLPDGTQLQLQIWPAGGEQAPNIVYRNKDDTSQVSSQYSDSGSTILLTVTGSY
jgi:hypothetical protein